jgi:hypothetical protein
MESGFTNSGKGDSNEPKSEGPITSKMSEYVILRCDIPNVY